MHTEEGLSAEDFIKLLEKHGAFLQPYQAHIVYAFHDGKVSMSVQHGKQLLRVPIEARALLALSTDLMDQALADARKVLDAAING